MIGYKMITHTVFRVWILLSTNMFWWKGMGDKKYKDWMYDREKVESDKMLCDEVHWCLIQVFVYSEREIDLLR